jgi:hypothetical protein
MSNKEELRILWGLVRRINNTIYGYKKPTGRPRGKNKKVKNNNKRTR